MRFVGGDPTQPPFFAMHILYVDEAGDGGTGKGSTQHLVLAGAAMHEAQWRQLTRVMNEAQMRHFPEAGALLELHAGPLRAGRKEFRGIPQQKRLAALTDIYRQIGSVRQGLTMFAAVIHKSEYHLAHKGLVDPYAGAFEGLCTMFNFFLHRLQERYGRSERGIVVIDYADPALSNQLRALLARFQATGTQWTVLKQVIETPFFFDSKTSRLMQVVDFASYAVFRWYEHGDDTYLRLIYRKFDSQGSKVHGLKCYPLGCTKTFTP